MMLRHMGWMEAADVVETALKTMLLRNIITAVAGTENMSGQNLMVILEPVPVPEPMYTTCAQPIYQSTAPEVIRILIMEELSI